MIQKKSGYALFVTIVLILSMGIIISSILNITDKSLQESTDGYDYMQLNLLTKDIISIMQKAPELQDIKDAEDFNNILDLLAYIPLSLDTQHKAIIKVTSASMKININSIKSWNDFQKERFVSYLRDRGVSMPNFFLNTLMDLLKTKSNLTDIKRDIPSIHCQDIRDWRVFEKIERYYVTNTNDYSVFDVPWRDLITFRGAKIDANHINCEEWKLILPEGLDNSTIKSICRGEKIIKKLDELDLPKEVLTNVKKFNLTTNAKEIEITIKFLSKKKKDIISRFFYDIESKKVSDVSMAL